MTTPRTSSLAVGAIGFIVVIASILTACSSSDGEAATAPSTRNTTTTTTIGDPSPTVDQGVTVTDTTSTTTTSTADSTTSSSTRETEGVGEGGGCAVGPVPAAAGLDAFYTQGCQIDGFWVVANEVVEPEAIVRAADTVTRLFATDRRLASSLAADGIRLGIIGRNQRTTEMPEYWDLNEVFPDTDWDTRARGLGATLERPLVSAGEENLLCLREDPYFGEDILLHEFSHVLHQFGYRTLESDFDVELGDAYQAAMDNGTWDGTYATINPDEYWAEGVQSYLGRNLTAEPADGIHGPIDTRAELQTADPALFTLIDDRLDGLTLPPQCD